MLTLFIHAHLGQKKHMIFIIDLVIAHVALSRLFLHGTTYQNLGLTGRCAPQNQTRQTNNEHSIYGRWRNSFTVCEMRREMRRELSTALVSVSGVKPSGSYERSKNATNGAPGRTTRNNVRY